MKLVFRLSIGVIALLLFSGAFTWAYAQSEPFVAQLTSSASQSFAADMTGDGRFVVVASNGDIGTKEPALGLNPDNSDGNREIFLVDYAQRRTFQITNTKSRLIDTAVSPLTQSNIQVEILNVTPVISHDGLFIALISNANSLTPAGSNTSTPGNFDANTLSNADRDALLADANWEVWIYQIPPLSGPPVDLSSGVEPPFDNLSTGVFTRVTNTTASQTPQPGTVSISPVTAADNRDVATNDDGSIVAFVSTRNFPGAGASNADANPEIFTHLRSAALNSVSQITDTQAPDFSHPVSCTNPSLSAIGTRVAYICNANIVDTGQTVGNNADGNQEVYYADLSPTLAVTNNKQVTRTTRITVGDLVNVLSPGRRLSRDGNLIAFESTADLANSTPAANATTFTVFVYNITSNSFVKVGARGAEDTTAGSDILRFPTFTDYVGTTPGTLILISRLNFKSDGTIPTTATDGLNPDDTRPVQIYAVTLPVGVTPSFTRLTKTPPGFVFSSIQAYPSDSRQRIAFSHASPELGTANFDGGPEAFYLLTPAPVPLSENTIADTYFTGATMRPSRPSPSPSPTATPTPTPTPSPTPTPTTPLEVPGLSPGMLAVAVFPSRFVIPGQFATGTSTRRRPSLPIELGGVSMSVSGAAAGLYSVSRQRIVFVVPPGLTAVGVGTTHPIVINVRGHFLRGSVILVPAQPDIFSSTNSAGGRAEVRNAFNGTREPFTVFTVRPRDPRAPTILRIIVTGVLGAPSSVITVRIGSTTLSGAAIRSGGVDGEMPGYHGIDVELPEAIAGAGDVPIIIIITVDGQTFTSRVEDTAPHITIL